MQRFDPLGRDADGVPQLQDEGHAAAEFVFAQHVESSFWLRSVARPVNARRGAAPEGLPRRTARSTAVGVGGGGGQLRVEVPGRGQQLGFRPVPFIHHDRPDHPLAEVRVAALQLGNQLVLRAARPGAGAEHEHLLGAASAAATAS